MVVNTWTAILERLIDPENANLPPDAARFILGIDFPPEDHDRVAELQTKAGAGMLSGDDRAELDEYLRMADLVALLQSKARRSLRRADAS
jgi:hypothetical protein